MNKKSITEINAAAAIMDSIFTQVDNHWYEIWHPVEQGVVEAGLPIPKSDFVKFNYSLAVLAVNFRAAFDLFERTQAERLFSLMLQLLQKQLGTGTATEAVKSMVLDEKYYAPEPEVVAYLERSLMLFTGKWENLLERFELKG